MKEQEDQMESVVRQPNYQGEYMKNFFLHGHMAWFNVKKLLNMLNVMFMIYTKSMLISFQR